MWIEYPGSHASCWWCLLLWSFPRSWWYVISLFFLLFTQTSVLCKCHLNFELVVFFFWNISASLNFLRELHARTCRLILVLQYQPPYHVFFSYLRKKYILDYIKMRSARVVWLVLSDKDCRLMNSGGRWKGSLRHARDEVDRRLIGLKSWTL